jgi:hypothetical protein
MLAFRLGFNSVSAITLFATRITMQVSTRVTTGPVTVTVGGCLERREFQDRYCCRPHRH